MTVPATETTPTPTPTPAPTPTPTPTPTPPTPAPAPTPTGADPLLGDAGKQAIDRMKDERDTARREKAAEAKRAKDLETELATIRQASMTDTEKAVAEAETRGRQTATTELGEQLARARFDGLAARRNPELTPEDVEKTLEFVDMRRFLNDKGEVDVTALTGAVERLVPEAGTRRTPPPSYDGGARQTTVPVTTVEPGMPRLREAYKEQPTRA